MKSSIILLILASILTGCSSVDNYIDDNIEMNRKRWEENRNSTEMPGVYFSDSF